MTGAPGTTLRDDVAAAAGNRTLWGAFVSSDSPHVAEMMGRSGFDWLVVDTQHAPVSGSGNLASMISRRRHRRQPGAGPDPVEDGLRCRDVGARRRGRRRPCADDRLRGGGGGDRRRLPLSPSRLPELRPVAGVPAVPVVQHRHRRSPGAVPGADRDARWTEQSRGNTRGAGHRRRLHRPAGPVDLARRRIELAHRQRGPARDVRAGSRRSPARPARSRWRTPRTSGMPSTGRVWDSHGHCHQRLPAAQRRRPGRGGHPAGWIRRPGAPKRRRPSIPRRARAASGWPTRDGDPRDLDPADGADRAPVGRGCRPGRGDDPGIGRRARAGGPLCRRVARAGRADGPCLTRIDPRAGVSGVGAGCPDRCDGRTGRRPPQRWHRGRRWPVGLGAPDRPAGVGRRHRTRRGQRHRHRGHAGVQPQRTTGRVGRADRRPWADRNRLVELRPRGGRARRDQPDVGHQPHCHRGADR